MDAITFLIGLNSLLCIFTILLVLSRSEDKKNFEFSIFSQLNKIEMTQQELLEALKAVGVTLRKGIDEVKTAIANSGNVSAEVEAALGSLSAAADELDAIVPDPEPEPPVE